LHNELKEKGTPYVFLWERSPDLDNGD